MGRSAIVAVRSTLVAAVSDLPAFADIPVRYCYDRECVDKREFVVTRDATFEHATTALRSGRNFRNEVGTFELVVWVEKVGGTPQEAAERALDLGQVVEEYVADNKNGIGGAGDFTLQVDGTGSLSEMASDSSSFAELVYSIKYQARLT
jgi:hypothetical protein